MSDTRPTPDMMGASLTGSTTRIPKSVRAQLPIVLVGMPGSGKTTVGRLLAQRLGVPHIDSDHLVEETQGRSICDIFAAEGERAFRAYEADAVAQAITEPSVVSLGGGAVTTPRVRELLAGHTVIFIDVPFDELLARVSRKNTRPLLRENPEETLGRLDNERRPLFTEVATFQATSDHRPVDIVVARILDHLSRTSRVTVSGESPYDVILNTPFPASHIRAALPADTQRLLIIHSPGVTRYAHQLAATLRADNYHVSLMGHPDGEAAKTVNVLADGWDAAADAGLSRRDAIISVGGGATSDLAGFIAATWLRGIAVIHVPTTVLATVDAAVGGKTGINTPAGKNLAGAFHPPHAVIANYDMLHTLPAAEHAAGLGEVVKCGFIRDTAILDLALNTPHALADAHSPKFADAIARAVAVKADVVGADLKESGLREILNYGHTLAHAIEKCEHYQWRHGEAVAVGCVFAAELACDKRMITAKDVDLHRRAFEAVGLPTSYHGASLSSLVDVMFSDKKVRGGQLRFVLLDGIGNPTTVPISAEELTAPAQRIGITQ